MEDIKTFSTTIILLIIGVTLLASAVWHSNKKPHIIYKQYPNNKILGTSNRLNCQELGGRYVLTVEPNGEVDYEWCEISKKIKYDN
jgi:hypothetical protein